MLKENDINTLKRDYPAGTKVKLICMKDEDQMPSGLIGIVQFVDDIGQIHVAWENGSSLAINPDVDEFVRMNS